MYNVVPWSPELDLAEFYDECAKRGHLNNASQAVMVDAFNGYKRHQIWMIYYEGKPIGSFGAHSLDEFDRESYRICVRACVLTDRAGLSTLRTVRQIATHQHILAQVAVPQCIEWVGNTNAPMFVTSYPCEVGRQRAMHEVGLRAVDRNGSFHFFGELNYQNKIQSFWQLDIDEFNAQIDKYPRWPKIFSEKPLTLDQLRLYNTP